MLAKPTFLATTLQYSLTAAKGGFFSFNIFNEERGRRVPGERQELEAESLFTIRFRSR